MNQMQQTSVSTSHKTAFKVSYAQRVVYAHHPLTKKLFQLMERKKTNLAFNPDVTSKQDFLRLVDEVGPYICVLKTHIDIINDFDDDLVMQLLLLAEKHDFLIFEDRKFADIGSVVQMQYRDGIYHIADWADITNAHIVAGPGIIDALKEVGKPKGRGLLLLAQMSSKGNMLNQAYTQTACTLAQTHPDFVMGFICQERVSDDPGFIHMTPGVQMAVGGDQHNQQYRTPHDAIAEQYNDIMIVGRGIYGAANPGDVARDYRDAGWQAYEALIK